jgi:hypothetical protein
MPAPVLPHNDKEIEMNDKPKPTLAAILADMVDSSDDETGADRPAPGTEDE